MKPELSNVHIAVNNEPVDFVIKKEDLNSLLKELCINNIPCYCPVKEARLNGYDNTFYFDLIIFFERVGHYNKFKNLLDKYIYKGGE